MKQRASFGGAVQNLNADIVRDLEIAVPPLSVQENIVKILDRFDKLNNDMSEGLPAEIEARKSNMNTIVILCCRLTIRLVHMLLK